MLAVMSKFIDWGGSADAGSKKWTAEFLKLFPGTFGQRFAVAAVVFIHAVFDRSPLLMFVLVGLAVCAYVAIQDSNNSTRSSR
jgi:hypothetical protein